MNDFLPGGYEVPKNQSNYMKFEQGANSFRFLSKPVIGYVYWIETEQGRRPVRVKTIDEVDNAVISKENPVRHFWAAVVYDYTKKQISVLEITQKSILDAIYNLARNEKWGSPLGYDITVTKKGEKLATEYTVMPEPKVVLAAGIRDQFEKVNINLEALFTNGDPFAGNGNSEGINIDDIPFGN